MRSSDTPSRRLGRFSWGGFALSDGLDPDTLEPRVCLWLGEQDDADPGDGLTYVMPVSAADEMAEQLRLAAVRARWKGLPKRKGG